jgi:hypothetical protein
MHRKIAFTPEMLPNDEPHMVDLTGIDPLV